LGSIKEKDGEKGPLSPRRFAEHVDIRDRLLSIELDLDYNLLKLGVRRKFFWVACIIMEFTENFPGFVFAVDPSKISRGFRNPVDTA
jgi:hypothetical protein